MWRGDPRGRLRDDPQRLLGPRFEGSLVSFAYGRNRKSLLAGICIPFTSRVTLAMTPRLSERLFLHLLNQASHVRRVELSEGEMVLPWQTMWYLHVGGSQGRKADSFWWWLNLACPLTHEDTSQWRCLLCWGCCRAGPAESPGSCLAPSPVLFPPLLKPPHSLRGWGSGAEWKYNEHPVLSLAPGTELLKPSC